MYKIKIISIEKATRVGNDLGVIEVIADIIKEGEETPVQTLKREYPLSSTQEEIQAAMKKALDLFVSEQAKVEEQKEVSEQNKNADQVISGLTGSEIK